MGAFYLPFGFKGKKKKMETIPETKTDFKKTGDLTKDVINYFLKKEGGLSRDINDSASKDPAPCEYNGKTGWHTNKGVTYSAYKDFCKKMKLQPTCEDFFKMDLLLWTAIFNEGYYKPFVSQTQNNFARFLFAWVAWGSGAGGARNFFKNMLSENKFGSIDEMIKNIGEKEFFKRFTERQIKIYKKIAEVKPQNKKFLKGWINSVSEFFNNFKTYTK